VIFSTEKKEGLWMAEEYWRETPLPEKGEEQRA